MISDQGWDGCTVLNVPGQKTLVGDVMSRYRVYPGSCHPRGHRSWEGIAMPEWFETVMATMA